MPVTAAVIGGGAIIGQGIMSSRAQRQQQAAQQQLMQSAMANPAAIFGTTPEFEPVAYNPLFREDPGYAGLVRDIIRGNRRNLGVAGDLSSNVNRMISNASRRRIQGWDPSFVGNLQALAQTRDLTSQGYLPYEDAMNIIGSRGRMGADLGIAGGTGAQTARDLGMTRLQLMTETGPGLAARITDIINAVDPIQRHATPNEYLLPTQAGVGAAIQENQFAANFGFQQNMAMAGFNALPNPQAQGLFNLQAFQAGFAGQGAQALAGTIGQIGSMASMFAMMGGMGRGGAGAAGSQRYFGAPAGSRNLDFAPVGSGASNQFFG